MNGVRYRKNIVDLTAQELHRLRVAFEKLYAISAQNRWDERGYSWIAGVHGMPPPQYCEHGSIHFTTWHRTYLYRFELLLRDQDSSVVLPYWDWTSDESLAEGLPTAVTDATYVDPVAAESRPNPLASAYNPVDDAMTSRTPQPLPRLRQLRTLVRQALVAPSFGEFSSLMENPHNGLHVWVGGDMGAVRTAAYDPLFWFHHCNVDRLFWVWQQQHPNARYPESVLRNVHRPFEHTGDQTIDTAQLGYSYAESHATAPQEAFITMERGGDELPARVWRLGPVGDGFGRALLSLRDYRPPAHSRQVHVFVNQPTATEADAVSSNPRFAGTFHLFGKGACGGAEGHCDPNVQRGPYDLRRPHHLAPRTMTLDISTAIRHLVVGRVGRPNVEVSLVVLDDEGQRIDTDEVEFKELDLTLRDDAPLDLRLAVETASAPALPLPGQSREELVFAVSNFRTRRRTGYEGQQPPEGDQEGLLVTGTDPVDRAPKHELLESVIDDDTRERITSTKASPWRRICSLSIVAESGATYVGTGFLVGPGTIVTAGHCVHHADLGGWASKIIVSAGRDGDQVPYGSFTSDRYGALAQWVNDADPDFDIGVIQLDERLGDLVGWFGLGALPDSSLKERRVNISGYPADKDPRGREQWFSHNRLLSVSRRRLYYEVDTFGGQSGSPVWIYEEGREEPVVIGVHAYGIGGTPSSLGIVANSAPRITPQVFDIIVGWVQEGPSQGEARPLALPVG
ncbi:MAG: tyrosinase family protein [Planctomycetota bacterium]|nr:tyrosinase family protein [Planctomycetota bacterium]